MDRRAYLAVVAGAITAGCSTRTEETPTEETPTENENEVPPEETENNHPPIDTSDRLVNALASATDGDVVTVPPDAEINLDGWWGLTVPAGVTLRGGRTADVAGALLKSPDGDKTPESNSVKRKLHLETGARLTGFRLSGHFHEYVNPAEAHDSNYYAHRGGGGVTVKKDAELDNNEISGWPYAAVVARANAHIHDNHIHHNTWEGLGYGVAIPEGNHMPVIESNQFNYNRHCITGSGGPQCGFIARSNVVGDEWVGSAFDMHGTEGMDGIAGGRIVITRNLFKATSAVEAKTRAPGRDLPAIHIRGTPTEGVWVEQNWFYHDEREHAVRQTNGFENMYFERNHYGRTDPPTATIGPPKS